MLFTLRLEMIEIPLGIAKRLNLGNLVIAFFGENKAFSDVIIDDNELINHSAFALE
jgi:hypothetical protein